MVLSKKTFSAVIFSILFAICSCSGNDSNGGNSPTSSSSKEITFFEIINPVNAAGVINEPEKTISVTVPCGTDVSKLVARFSSTGVKVTISDIEQISGTTVTNFTTTVKYKVIAQDGSESYYSVKVTVAPNTAKEITSFTVTGQDSSTIDGTNITVVMPCGSSITSLAPKITYTGKSITPGSGVSQNFSTPVKYTVTAEDSTTSEYTVSAINAIEKDAYWTSGDGTKDNPYIIYTADDLSHLATAVNSGKTYSKTYLKMANDIDLNYQPWTPIGTSAWFMGIFDGNGHSITSLYTNTNRTYAGLFGKIKNAVIKNLSIKGTAPIQCGTSCYIGSIAGYALSSSIENCSNAESVSGVITSSSGSAPSVYVGGIIGYTDSTSIIQCINSGAVKGQTVCSISRGTAYSYVGGITGYESNNSSVSSCVNSSKITGICTGSHGSTTSGSTTSSYTMSAESNTGGLIGYGESSSISLSNNTGSVTVTGNDMPCYGGGLIAYSRSMSVTGCYNNASVAATYVNSDGENSSGRDLYAGGITANTVSSTFKNVANKGNVTAISSRFSCCAGGIAGQSYVSNSYTNCFNSGTVSSTGNGTTYGGYIFAYTGGIIGCIAVSSSSANTVTDCYNTGAINCTAQKCFAGGIVGYDTGASYLYSYNTGTITGSGTYRYEGGIAGYCSSSPLVRYCYYLSACASNPTTTDINGTSTSGSDMQSANFVTALNTGATSWKSDTGSNGGYPVLIDNNP
jgi:hypothetical protein